MSTNYYAIPKEGLINIAIGMLLRKTIKEVMEDCITKLEDKKLYDPYLDKESLEGFIELGTVSAVQGPKFFSPLGEEELENIIDSSSYLIMDEYYRLQNKVEFKENLKQWGLCYQPSLF